MKFLTGLLFGLGLSMAKPEAVSVERADVIIRYPTIYSEATVPTKTEDELYSPRKDYRENHTYE
jgi:hypothetical protein